MNTKKIIYVTICSLFVFVPVLVHAQLKITEVMYDPEGSDTKREWIEVFNAGSEAIDLTKYYLLENNVYHKIVAQTEALLNSNTHAIIAGSVPEVLAEYPSFNGLIFDSVFSLNNTGESIAMANSLKETVDTFTYTSEMGAKNTGQSLQINEGAVITAGPTFGTINKTESETIVDEDSGDTTGGNTSGGSSSSGSSGSKDSSHADQVGLSNYTQPAQFKVGAGRSRTVSIHTPITFEGFISKSEIKAKYRWNFGDFETDKGQKTTHIYEYPGVYQVVLESYSKDYTATARTEVVVVEPQLLITQQESSITIENKDNKEINLGGFELKFLDSRLQIPQNSIIKAKSSIQIKNQNGLLLEVMYPDQTTYQSFPSSEHSIGEQILFDLI